MSTIASLLLAMDPKIKPYEEFERDWLANRRQETVNKTELIQLAELKRAQEAQNIARQYYQQNPDALLGGSTLGSLGSAQPARAPSGPPGVAPMTQPTLMPGQDQNQYNRVSPQGGGLSPQGMAQQLMPQVTPPPGSPPQGAPNHQQRLMDLARTNPDAAFAVMQQQQQQQDLALKRDEQRLTMGTKVAEYVGRVAQGVTSPETLEQARQELAKIHPQAAAQLPQTYSKEAMILFVKKAVGVKDNALLQLETWKNQIEEQKLGVQLANAGYQGLGTDVTGVLRGLTPEQVTEFGGRTSAKAIAYATEEEKKRKLGQAGEAERLKFELEQRQQSTLPLQDARKEDAGLFVYKGTGQGVPGTIPYGQIKTLQDEKDPEKGVIKLGNLDEKKQLTTLKQLEPVLQQYKDLAEYAYGTDQKTGKKGPMADYQRGPFQTIGAMWNQLSQDDPVFQAKRRALQGQLQSVVRGLGARGDLNAQELEAAQQMLANMDASLGLGLSLGPMVGSGGIGVGGSIKPSISLPDTPETGINIANELIGTVNRRIGSILQHEGYNKTPYIRIRTDQEREAKPGEMPRATAPPKPGPEPVPAPGQPIFPRPQIREPGASAPGTQSQVAPAPAPAPTPPLAPTAAPTPAATPPSQEESRTPATVRTSLEAMLREPYYAEMPVHEFVQQISGGTYGHEIMKNAPWQKKMRDLAPAERTRLLEAITSRETRPPGKQSQATTGRRGVELARASGFKIMEAQDIRDAMEATGRSRAEVIAAARSKGYTVYSGGGTAMA